MRECIVIMRPDPNVRVWVRKKGTRIWRHRNAYNFQRTRLLRPMLFLRGSCWLFQFSYISIWLLVQLWRQLRLPHSGRSQMSSNYDHDPQNDVYLHSSVDPYRARQCTPGTSFAYFIYKLNNQYHRSESCILYPPPANTPLHPSSTNLFNTSVMPLVVPGLSSNTADQSQNWMSKLAGKTIGTDHSEQVRQCRGILTDTETDWRAQSFAKGDLPDNHRVVKEGDMSTMDHDSQRMNIYVADDGTVRKVDFK